jgi:TatD DNase family protein
MTSGLVDFHCHLDLFPDMESAIREADAAGIYTLAVTTTPKAWPRNYNLTRGTRYVRAALGLHPQLAAERAGEISLWEEYLPEARYVGEVGLDAGPRFYPSFDLQRTIFTRILQKSAESGSKILSVHSVRSAKNVLDLIEQYFPSERGRVVLHWFTGSKSEARRASDLGCYFSINAAMMQSDRGRDLILSLPSERLLTETDAPFTQSEGRKTVVTDVGATVTALAGLAKVEATEMAGAIRSNLRALLSAVGISD